MPNRWLTLEILQGPRPDGWDRDVIPIGPAPVTLGRSDACDVALSDPRVSRRHAEIRLRGGVHVLEDCSSKHGTRLNGESVTGTRDLSEGDVLELAAHCFRYREAPPQETVHVGLEQDAASVVLSAIDAGKSLGVTEEIKLRAVLEILRSQSGSARVDDFLPELLETLLRVYPQAARGVVLFLETGEGGPRWFPRASRSRSALGGDVRLSQTILRQVADERQAVLSADAVSDEAFSSSHSVVDQQIRSVICSPLLRQDGQVIGAVQLHSEDVARPFQPEDLDLLVSVAGTTALALENLRLHEDLLQQEKLRRELELAQEVQRHFLPAAEPEVPQYRFFAYYRPALTVSGDYYGYLELPDQRLAVAVGDVAGKGMPAALLMARLSSDVRSALLRETDPGLALSQIHRSLSESGIDDKFVTLILAVLDPLPGTLTVANAGHIPLILRRPDGELRQVGTEVAGFPLMVSPESSYRYGAETVTIDSGEAVFAVSDGIIEAMDPQGELFGAARLESAVRDAPRNVVEAGPRLVRAVEEFAAGTPQHDDMTLVCFERL